MWKHETEEFSKYEVYEHVDGKVHYLCLCEEFEMAVLIAKMFACKDPTHDKYYVTGVSVPGTLVPGGGWYYCYYTDEEGKLHETSLE